MEFKKRLHKLKYSDRWNRSSLSQEIIANIHDVNEAKLSDILEILHCSGDMEHQVKLISILTAYLLLNNSRRDLIIKSTFLYDTLRMILSRGLPLKTAITLNFITSLLYAEDEGSSRSRSLTLHAQNLIRNSGCLKEMSYMFMNFMLHTETFQALCRCLAEVCRGSELNQNVCSHLIPLCVQRCVQGNSDVLPVLQSLLSNHKRNTNLFMETNGAMIFNRKDYLRSEACLQLLSIVIQNAEVEALNTMSSEVHENLQELLKMKSANLSIVQWATIVLYYLDSKLKDKDNYYKATTSKLKQNSHMDKTSHMDSYDNDTQILFQNIMSEILSYPSQNMKTHDHNLPSILNKVSNKSSNIRNNSRLAEETKLLNKNIRTNLARTQAAVAASHKFNMSHKKRLSFSFLMDESSVFNVPDGVDNNNCLKHKVNQTVLDKKTNQNTAGREYSNLTANKPRDTLRTFNSSYYVNMTDFKPAFVSTPKRPNKMHSIPRTSTRTSLGQRNKSRIINRTIKKIPKKNVLQEKHDIKHKSMSSRIFEAINESCTTVLRSFKNVFAGNKYSNDPTQDASKMNTVKDEDPFKNDDQDSYCSYSFTNYMYKREAALIENGKNKDASSKMETFNTLNICNTCDDTFLLQQKLASDERLKSTVKKLKLGINIYGCDFKRISKTLWPTETYMTPNVLYNLYRKLLLK